MKRTLDRAAILALWTIAGLIWISFWYGVSELLYFIFTLR